MRRSPTLRSTSTRKSSARRSTCEPRSSSTAESPGWSRRIRFSRWIFSSSSDVAGRRRRERPRRCGRQALEHLDALADQVHPRLVTAVEPALDGHDGVVERACGRARLQHPWEQRHLDRRLEVLEHERRHLVALAGELPRQPGDHPADVHGGAVAQLGEVADRLLDLAPQRGLDAEQRVVRDVQPEHLLLVAQLLGLLELDVGHGDPLVEPRPAASSAVVAAPVAEQAHHATLALTAAARAWCR